MQTLLICGIIFLGCVLYISIGYGCAYLRMRGGEWTFIFLAENNDPESLAFLVLLWPFVIFWWIMVAVIVIPLLPFILLWVGLEHIIERKLHK